MYILQASPNLQALYLIHSKLMHVMLTDCYALTQELYWEDLLPYTKLVD